MSISLVPRCSLPGRSFVSWSDTSVLRIRWTLYYVHFSVLFLLLSYLFISFSLPPSPTLPDAVAASSHSRKLFEYEPSLETSFQLSASSFSYIYARCNVYRCIIYIHMQDICNNFSFLVHTLHECSNLADPRQPPATDYLFAIRARFVSLSKYFFRSFFFLSIQGKEKRSKDDWSHLSLALIVQYEIKQDERRFSLGGKSSPRPK